MKKLFLVFLVIMVGVSLSNCAMLSQDCPREDINTVVFVDMMGMSIPMPVQIEKGKFNKDKCGWQKEHTHVTTKMWEKYQEKLKEDPEAYPDGYVEELEGKI